VVAGDVEHVHVALAAGAGVARALARADDVELLVVVREAEAVGIRHLILADDEIPATAGAETIDARRGLALGVADLQRLAQPGLETAGLVAGPARRVRRALVELTAVRRIREPVAAGGGGGGVGRGGQPLCG